MNDRHALVPASYVYLRRGNDVLLQQRANTGYMDGHWAAGAAGHIELHETSRDAAVREAREELGVVIAEADLEFVTVMERTDGTDELMEQRVDWFWCARTWSGEPSLMEPHKSAGLRWWPLEALPRPLPGYERLALELLGNATAPASSPVTSFGFDGRS